MASRRTPLPRKPYVRTGGKKGGPAVNPNCYREISELMARGWSGTQIVRELLDPNAPAQIRSLFSNKTGVPLSDRTVYSYIAHVRAELELAFKEEAPHRASMFRLMVRDHYERSLSARHFAAAGQSLDRLAKMDGHYRPERVELAGAGGGPVTIASAQVDLSKVSDEELEKLGQLATKVGAAVSGGIVQGAAAGGAADQDRSGEGPPRR